MEIPQNIFENIWNPDMRDIRLHYLEEILNWEKEMKKRINDELRLSKFCSVAFRKRDSLSYAERVIVNKIERTRILYRSETRLQRLKRIQEQEKNHEKSGIGDSLFVSRLLRPYREDLEGLRVCILPDQGYGDLPTPPEYPDITYRTLTDDLSFMDSFDANWREYNAIWERYDENYTSRFLFPHIGV